MFRYAFVGLVAVVAGFARADDGDATRTELLKAKQTFTDTSTKARTTLLAAIDETIKSVAAGGDLDGVKAIQNERKVFEESGKTPTTAKLGTAVGEYARATKQARAVLDKAYDQAVKVYTKALKIELAEAVRKEWKEGQAPMVVVKESAKKTEPAAPKNKWIAGRWDVRYTPNGTTRTYIIRADGALMSEKGDEVLYRIKQQGGELLLDFGDRMERLTFADNRLFIEHFWPKGDFEKNVPNQVGIGELVKKK